MIRFKLGQIEKLVERVPKMRSSYTQIMKMRRKKTQTKKLLPKLSEFVSYYVRIIINGLGDRC